MSVSAYSQFLQGSAMLDFLHRGCWVTQLTHGLFQLCVLSLPHRQKGNIPFMHLAISFVQRKCNRLPSCIRVWGSLPNSLLHSPDQLVVLLGWKRIATRQHRQVAGKDFGSSCDWHVLLPEQLFLSAVLQVALLLVRLQVTDWEICAGM
jgi:hypothetical protein